MPKSRPKPPKERRDELKAQVTRRLTTRFTDPEERVEFLLDFFTGLDLLMIREGLDDDTD